jgi:hypothetical protein
LYGIGKRLRTTPRFGRRTVTPAFKFKATSNSSNELPDRPSGIAWEYGPRNPRRRRVWTFQFFRNPGKAGPMEKTGDRVEFGPKTKTPNPWRRDRAHTSTGPLYHTSQVFVPVYLISSRHDNWCGDWRGIRGAGKRLHFYGVVSGPESVGVRWKSQRRQSGDLRSQGKRAESSALVGGMGAYGFRSRRDLRCAGGVMVAPTT